MGKTRWQLQEKTMRRNERKDYEQKPHRLFHFISPGWKKRTCFLNYKMPHVGLRVARVGQKDTRCTSKLKVQIIMGNEWVMDAGKERRHKWRWALRKLVGWMDGAREAGMKGGREGWSERVSDGVRDGAAVLSALAYHRRWSAVKPSA